LQISVIINRLYRRGSCGSIEIYTVLFSVDFGIILVFTPVIGFVPSKRDASVARIDFYVLYGIGFSLALAHFKLIPFGVALSDVGHCLYSYGILLAYFKFSVGTYVEV